MRKAFIYSFIIIACVVLMISCNKETDPINPGDPTGTGATRSFTSTDNGSFDYDGFSIVVKTETIPRLENGNSGTVVLSMNTSASMESGIPAIPSGYSVIGKFLKAGPESFVFNIPVQVYFPAANESSPQNLVVFNYSPDLQSWKIVSSSAIDTAGRRIGVDVLQLGYFVLTKKTTSDNMSDFRQGGCVFDHEELWTDFILTVNTAALEKPEQLALFSNGFIGGTYSGPIFLGCPIGKTKAIVPQGTIGFWISKRLCQGSDQRVYTYTIPASVTVSDPLNFIGWSTYDAVIYVPFTFPSGGTWVLGRPGGGAGAWPPATIPFGSGLFQATLTWYNSSESIADLDLHLYGPNNLHIFWQNRTSPDFTLDRDWTSQTGNAIENIFSLNNTIPSGSYEVKVHNFSGVSKNFNTRVILNGASTNFAGSLSLGQEVTVRTFTIP